jgi:hypothetical protein
MKQPFRKMARRGLMGAAAAAALFAVSFGSAMADEDFDGLPAGEGREIVFYACQGCHSLTIVKRSRFSRRVWDEVLDWMVDTHGMAELPDDLHEIVLDYLTEHYGLER